jgi:hypothetical protein
MIVAHTKVRHFPLVVLIGFEWVFAINAASVAGEPAITLLDPPNRGFFSKQIVCQGIPLKAHRDVQNAALIEAWRRMERMLEHAPVVVANLVDAGAELHIIGRNQVTSDLPYLRHWKGKAYESYGKTFESIDARTRGIGQLRGGEPAQAAVGSVSGPSRHVHARIRAHGAQFRALARRAGDRPQAVPEIDGRRPVEDGLRFDQRR